MTAENEFYDKKNKRTSPNVFHDINSETRL